MAKVVKMLIMLLIFVVGVDVQKKNVNAAPILAG